MNIEEEDIREGIETAGGRLAHLHVGENNRRPARPNGHIPWDEVAAGLQAIDYDGPVLLEPFVLPNGTIAQDIGIWQELNTVEELDTTAADSLEFVRETFNQ